MNQLNDKARLRILKCLLEGVSIRSTARIVGVSKTTVLKLLAESGKACLEEHRKTMKNLKCERIQMDEIWSFVHSKKRPQIQKHRGDMWTWIALDPDSKVVPCWLTGDRDSETAERFIKELSTRIEGKTELASDGLRAYEIAIAKYMKECNYGMLIKHHTKNKKGGKLVIRKEPIQNKPNMKNISTSYIERHNLNIRMSVRRFTRKTNAFSKNIVNHTYALALHFYHYNFVRRHKSLGTTPCNAMGISKERGLESILKLMEGEGDKR